MPKDTLPVTFQNYGMLEFAINLNNEETITDGILDAVSYMYWLFDDNSGMPFSVHIQYKVNGKRKIRGADIYDWEDGLKGVEKYLNKVRNIAFKRAMKKDITELCLELRILDSDIFHALGPVREMVDMTAHLRDDDNDSVMELMQAHYPERYRELLEQSAEYNK